MRSGSEPATEGSGRANGAERARAARPRSGMRAWGVPLADRSAARDAPLNDALERQSGDAPVLRGEHLTSGSATAFLTGGPGGTPPGGGPSRWALRVGDCCAGCVHRDTRLARAIGPCCGSRALSPFRLWASYGVI